MPIAFKPCIIEEFILHRKQHANKTINSKYLRLFNTQVFEIINELPNITGFIKYKNGDDVDNIIEPFLNFNYGSPAPYLFKLLPNGYGFNYFEPNDIYKKCHIETDIRGKLYNLHSNGFFTRYAQPKEYKPIRLPEDFILVVMQNTTDTVWYRNQNFTKLANEIIAWSRESKKKVLFKWHFGCLDHSDPKGWWNELEEKSDYAYFDYTTPLNILIEKCNMLWTASSMSGIEALIYNKPVSIFGQTEYMEMARVAKGPEDAINTSIPIDLDQWLTYYVRKYCINILDKNAKELIQKRIINFFDLGLNVDELIVSY
jgi:hypothetical protein